MSTPTRYKTAKIGTIEHTPALPHKICCHATPQKMCHLITKNKPFTLPKSIATSPHDILLLLHPQKLFCHPTSINCFSVTPPKIFSPHPTATLHHNSMSLVQFQHLCMAFLHLNIYACPTSLLCVVLRFLIITARQ